MSNLKPLIECIKNAGDSVAKHGFRPVFRDECSTGVLVLQLLRHLPYPAEFHQIAETHSHTVAASKVNRLFCEVSTCQDEQPYTVDVTMSWLPDKFFTIEELRSISTRQLQDSHHAVVWGVRSGQAWRTALNPDFAFEFGDNNEFTCLLWLKNWSN